MVDSASVNFAGTWIEPTHQLLRLIIQQTGQHVDIDIYRASLLPRMEFERVAQASAEIKPFEIKELVAK